MTQQQFSEQPPRRPRPAAEEPEPRVTLRSRSARVLRTLANRLEPEPRCA